MKINKFTFTAYDSEEIGKKIWIKSGEDYIEGTVVSCIFIKGDGFPDCHEITLELNGLIDYPKAD